MEVYSLRLRLENLAQVIRMPPELQCVAATVMETKYLFLQEVCFGAVVFAERSGAKV
jgi:hypothetical protein